YISYSLGRIILLSGVMSSVVFTHMILRPNGPVFGSMEEEAKPPLLVRARLPLYLLAMFVPLSIGALSVVGYTYTSGQMLTRYADTAMMIVGVVLFNELTGRWFDLSEHRIALGLRKRKLRRKADKKASAADGEDDIDLEVLRAHTASLRHSIT